MPSVEKIARAKSKNLKQKLEWPKVEFFVGKDKTLVYKNSKLNLCANNDEDIIINTITNRLPGVEDTADEEGK